MEALAYYTLQADDWNQPGAVALRSRYTKGDEAAGWAMQGRYWALCGIVARAGGRLDLGQEYLRDYTKKALSLDEEQLTNFLKELAALRLVIIEGKVLTIPSINDDLERMTTASTRGKKAASTRWKEQGFSPRPGKQGQEPPSQSSSQPQPEPAPVPADPAPSVPEPIPAVIGQLELEPTSARAAPLPGSDASAMHPQCTSNASAMHPQCTSNASAMHPQCASNASALQVHMHTECMCNADAMLKKEGRKEETERALQALSVSSCGGIQERKAPALVDNSDRPLERSPPRRSGGEVNENDWLQLARLWGPLFEWAAREARGLQGNPITCIRTRGALGEHGIAEASA